MAIEHTPPIINPATGAPYPFGEGEARIVDDDARRQEIVAAELSKHIEAGFRDRHPILATHPKLRETAYMVAARDGVDVANGAKGLNVFHDKVAAELSTPESTGLVAELSDWQHKHGFY